MENVISILENVNVTSAMKVQVAMIKIAKINVQGMAIVYLEYVIASMTILVKIAHRRSANPTAVIMDFAKMALVIAMKVGLDHLANLVYYQLNLNYKKLVQRNAILEEFV